MALTELYIADRATTTVSSGGTTAPSGGTVESWTVASSAMFGAAVASVSQFHVADPAAPTEIIAVTAVSGTTWTVTRGADSTTPVTHSAGFTIYQVVTSGWLATLPAIGAGDLGGTQASPAITSTHLTVVTNSSATGTVNLDPTATRVFKVTQTGNTTFTFTGTLTAGTSYSFELYLFPVTYTTAWPGSVTWIGGTAPTLTPSALNLLVFETVDGGTTWYGSAVTEAPALPLAVANGGTGGAALGAYQVIAGGVTSTSALQAVSGVGTSGQVLTSNGASALPTWQAASGGVASVTAGDTSIVVGGTGTNPTVATGTLDVIATDNPPAANWSNNSHKITSLANGSGAQDAVAFGQTAAGGNTVTIAHGGTGQTTAAAAFNALNPNAAPAGFAPSNPASTTSLSLVMMGLGSTCTYTPTGSGLVLVNVTGAFQQATGTANSSIGPRYGTGTAPSNAAAVTGTRFGPATDYTTAKAAGIGVELPFAFTAVLTLTPATAYWFDLAIASGSGSDAASVLAVSMTMVEIP